MPALAFAALAATAGADESAASPRSNAALRRKAINLLCSLSVTFMAYSTRLTVRVT